MGTGKYQILKDFDWGKCTPWSVSTMTSLLVVVTGATKNTSESIWNPWTRGQEHSDPHFITILIWWSWFWLFSNQWSRNALAKFRDVL